MLFTFQQPHKHSHSLQLAIHTQLAQHYIQQEAKFKKKINKKDLGMACHTPPLKKAKKQWEIPLPSLGLKM